VLPSATRGRDSVFDVSARCAVGALGRAWCAIDDHLGKCPGSCRIAHRDDLLQVSPAGVEPAAVQNGGDGQRRGRGILDGAGVPATVRTVPAPAGCHPVDDVSGEQFDPALGQRGGQHTRQFAMFVVAHPAVGAVFVDHHRDR
jgi:hypothetical protein